MLHNKYLTIVKEIRDSMPYFREAISKRIEQIELAHVQDTIIPEEQFSLYKFVKVRKIGDGSFGEVFFSLSTHFLLFSFSLQVYAGFFDGQEVAIKLFKELSSNATMEMENEVKIFQRLQSPYVFQFKF